MKDEYMMLFVGLVVLAVVVLATREQPQAPVIVQQPSSSGGSGLGGLGGLGSLGTSLLSAFGF